MYDGKPVKRTFADKSTNGALDHPSLNVVVLTQMQGWDQISNFQDSGFTPRHLFGFLEKRIKLYSSDYVTHGITNFGFHNLQRILVESLEIIMKRHFIPTIIGDGPDFNDFRFTETADICVCFFKVFILSPNFGFFVSVFRMEHSTTKLNMFCQKGKIF